MVFKKGNAAWNKGKKCPQISKGKIGYKHSELAKEKMKEAHTGKKLSDAHKNNIKKNANPYWEGKKLYNETKKKISETQKKNISLGRFNVDTFVKIGKNEKEILDKLERKKKINIKRQSLTAGYFVDGYDKKNNVVYEVDEKEHSYPKKKSYDELRDKKIIKELNCKVVLHPKYMRSYSCKGESFFDLLTI